MVERKIELRRRERGLCRAQPGVGSTRVAQCPFGDHQVVLRLAELRFVGMQLRCCLLEAVL